MSEMTNQDFIAETRMLFPERTQGTRERMHEALDRLEAAEGQLAELERDMARAVGTMRKYAALVTEIEKEFPAIILDEKNEL